MRFFALVLVVLVAFAGGAGAFLLFSVDRAEDAREALLKDLNQEISAEIKVAPTAVNPVAVSQAQASEVIAELPEVLKDLLETDVPLADQTQLEEATLASVEAIVEKDEELREASVPVLEQTVADSIAGDIFGLSTLVGANLSKLPTDQRDGLTSAILESTLAKLVEKGVPLAEGEEDQIQLIVEEVVDAEVEKAQVRGQVDEQALISDLTVAIAGLESNVTEAVNEDIEEAAGITEAVEGLDQGDLNLVTAAVADQVAELLVPDLNKRILEEDLNPGDPSDESEINSLIDLETAAGPKGGTAAGRSRPTGGPCAGVGG